MQKRLLWRRTRSTGEHQEGKRRKGKGPIYGGGVQSLLNLYHRDHRGVDDYGRLMGLLKVCGKQKDLEKGIKVHATILESGLFGRDDAHVGSMLINMYAKCGCLVKAQEVFDHLRARDVVSWTALISGYARCGHGGVALMYYEQMLWHGIPPNEVTFLCILKACGSIGALDKGEQIHAEIVKDGSMKGNVLIGTALVDMYAKCGIFAKALVIFNEILVHDVVLWTALVVGYVQHDHIYEAFDCFERMQCESLAPNEISFTCILKACSRSNNKSLKIHAMVVNDGLRGGKHSSIGNALIEMYAKSGALARAQRAFDELLIHDVVTWNALISGYVDQRRGEEAMCYFEMMRYEGLYPDPFTYALTLKACGCIGALETGKEVHGQIVEEDLLESDAVLGTSLVDMYAQCGAFGEACEMFHRLLLRDVVTWTALMAVYAEQEHNEETFDCFERMQCEGVCPNGFTMVCALKACGFSGASSKGEKLHARIVAEEALSRNLVLSNALLDMYAGCGVLAKARRVFGSLPIRDAISWNSLMSGYAHAGRGEDALECFGKMEQEGLFPDALTTICALKACASVAAIGRGKAIHARIERGEGSTEREALIETAIVDLYAKCGAPEEAHDIFDELVVQDEASWTALIAGYARRGQDKMVVELFDRMIEGGIKPSCITYAIVLSSCSHSGLVEKGQMYFEKMSSGHGVVATAEHYTCMLDLFGRAGQFGKVAAIIRKMPDPDHFPAWASLLRSCRARGDVELARAAFERMVRLDVDCEAAYVCMTNVYLECGLRNEAMRIEALRMERKVTTMQN